MALNVFAGRAPEGPPGEVFRADLRPNSSMSSRNLVLFVVSLGVLSFAIGVGFLSQGLWMVLPFAGLEIFVVGMAVGYVIRRSADYESVVIDEKNVTITRYRGDTVDRTVFQRYWARVSLVPGGSRLQPSRLLIGSHGRVVNVAAHMTESARQQLAAQLRCYVGAAGGGV